MQFSIYKSCYIESSGKVRATFCPCFVHSNQGPFIKASFQHFPVLFSIIRVRIMVHDMTLNYWIRGGDIPWKTVVSQDLVEEYSVASSGASYSWNTETSLLNCRVI